MCCDTAVTGGAVGVMSCVYGLLWCRAIFETKTKTRTIALRSVSTKTRTITNENEKSGANHTAILCQPAVAQQCEHNLASS